MFSTATISEITEQLRLAREEAASLARDAEKARTKAAEWSQLLEFAESKQEQPVDETVPPPAPGKQGSGWCWCGLPGTPGMLHNLTECRPGVPAPPPTLVVPSESFDELVGRADERVRGTFEPYRPGSPEKQGGTQ